jgi:phage/plasmid-associated DNA primase
MLTGNDSIPVGKTAVHINAKLFAFTNFLPKFEHYNDPAISNRVVVVDVYNSIKEDMIDQHLLDKLTTDDSRSAIATWLAQKASSLMDGDNVNLCIHPSFWACNAPEFQEKISPETSFNMFVEEYLYIVRRDTDSPEMFYFAPFCGDDLYSI